MAETIRKYWRRLVLAVILVFVVASGLFLGGIPPVVIPPTPPVGGIYSTDLYVNAFNVETGRDGWQRVGASPWIDAEDYSTNYIYSTVNLEKIGNFTFPNMPGDAASVINATLYAKIKTVAGAIRLEIMLWNGSWRTGIYAGTNNELVWVSTNVTAILDTIIEVNNAEIYIIASNAAATYNDIVDCVYLKVYYNVNEPPECTYYEVSPKHIGKVCNFTFNWTSGTGLEYVIFSWDSGTGSMQNDTAFDPWDGSPSTGQVTITKLLPMQLLVIKYQCYANDTTGWGDSGLLNFTSITEIELETQTLNATSYNNYSIPTVWVPIYMDKTFLAQAPGAWVDCFNASAEGYYRWIKLTDIDAEYNYVKGYEIQVIASAVWKNCTAVYSSCGGENQTHFIDGNTTTYWYHSSTHNHEIIVDIGESVRTYGLHIFMENQGDWVGVDVYGAPEQGWYVNGTSPYVNASDYPANYIYQNRTNQISAIVNFQSTSYISVKQATLFANISISDTGKKIEAQYENRSEWIVIQLNVTQANTWTLVNTTIEANFTENWLIYSLNVRFRTIGGDATFRVDETYLVIQVVNMTGIETAFSSATTGRNAIHYQTDVINAMFFGFLDTNAKWYKIIAFNLLTLEWTNTSDIADAGAWGDDPHWAPTTGALPNGSIAVFYGYMSKLKYRVTTYSAKEEANLTKLISNWNAETNITASNLVGYPDAITLSNKTLIFCREGGSSDGDTFQYTYENNAWSTKNLTYFVQKDSEDLYFCVYGAPTKINDTKIYYTYSRNANATGRDHVYLIVSLDGGLTWKHWNGTTLTTPIEGETAKVLNQTTICNYADNRLSVWDDENNKTNILYSYCANGFPYWYPMNGSEFRLAIALANDTVPNAIEWTNQTLKDEDGQDLMGQTCAFYDNKLNKTTLWVGPFHHAFQYPTKYFRVNGSDFTFWKYYVYTEAKTPLSSIYPILDYTAPFEARGEKYIRGICGYEDELPYQMWANKTWLFKFTATRDETVTSIALRIYNNGTTDEEIPYWVVIYNETEHILAKGYEQSLMGVKDAPPFDWWQFTSLNQTVNVTKGTKYWVGVIGMDDNNFIFYDNVTNGCFNGTAVYINNLAQPDYLGDNGDRVYYNRTASIYVSASKAVFYGLWYEPISLINGPYGAQADVETTLYCKWADPSGLSHSELWTNNTGPWALVETISLGNETTTWHNKTITINSSATCVLFEFRANCSTGKWGTTGIKTLMTYTPLDVGWTSFAPWDLDVGKTLGQVNASLNFDNIDWKYIGVQYPNGSQPYVFVKDYSLNADVQLEADVTIFIFSNVADKWYHNYD